MTIKTNIQLRGNFEKQFKFISPYVHSIEYHWNKTTDKSTGEREEMIEDDSSFKAAVNGWVKGDADSSKLLLLFNTLIFSLSRKHTGAKRRFISDTLSVYLKSERKNFRRFLSQLIALDTLASSGKYELFSMTSPSENGGDHEFIAYDSEEAKKVLVQVIPIDLSHSSRKIPITIEELQSMPAYQYGLTLDKVKGIENFIGRKAAIVFWGNYRQLQQITEYFKDSDYRKADTDFLISWYCLTQKDRHLLKYGYLQNIMPENKIIRS